MTKEEAFKNWGTLNGFSDEKLVQYRIAENIHAQDVEENPEAHRYAPTNYQQSSRGYSDSSCKCGFRIYVDSSD